MISIDYNILAEALASSKRRAARRCWRPSKVAECDGGGAAASGDAGAAVGGDAVAASASSGAADSTSSASETSSVDVLGSCNHAAGDGYLGKDCFHVPAKCAVPFHRWEIGNGGSKRKKTKKGKDKHYAYEKGMKVVYDMLHEDGEVDVGQMISEWNDTHLPRGRVNRHETGIPVKYWIAVDDYSEILNNYSCFVDWSLNLTPLANNHRPTFLTVDPSKIKELAKRAVAKWPDKYVFVGVDDSSRGMQTQKNHLRASVKYFWSPKYKMWNDALTFTESEEDVAKASFDATASTFKKYDGKAIDWEQITTPATDAGSGESHVWLRTPDGVLVCRVDPPQEAQDDSEPSAYCIVDQDAGKLVEVGNGYPRGFTTFHFNYQPTHKEEIPADMPRA